MQVPEAWERHNIKMRLLRAQKDIEGLPIERLRALDKQIPFPMVQTNRFRALTNTVAKP